MKTLLIAILIPFLVSLGAWFGIIKQQTPFGVEVPSVIALFETSLATKISSTATSMTLVSGTDKDGNSISGKFGFILDEGGADEEFVIADCVATACSNMLRGISVTTGKTEVAALQEPHRVGASVKMTDYPLLTILQQLTSGSASFEDLLYYSETIGTTGFGAAASTSNLATKYYVDYVGAGGFTSLNINTSDGIQVYGTAPETLGINLASSSTGSNMGGLYFTTGGKLSIYASTSNALYIDDDGMVSGIEASSSYAMGSLTLVTPLDELYGGLSTVSWDAGDMIYFSADNTAANIASGTENYVLSVSGGFPAWTSNMAYTNRMGGMNSVYDAPANTTPNTEEEVASISISANSWGINGGAKIHLEGQTVANGTYKPANIKVKFGESVIASRSIAEGTSYFMDLYVWNDGTLASQSVIGFIRASDNYDAWTPTFTTINTAIVQEFEFLYDTSEDSSGNSGGDSIWFILVEPYYSD